MLKRIFLFASIFSVTNGSTQSTTVIPTGTSIAGTSVSDSRKFTAFSNTANMSYISGGEAVIMYENRFLLKELSTKTVHVAYTLPFVTAGIQFSYMGYPLYHEMLTGIGFARNFENKFALGVQFNYFSTYFTGINAYRSAFFPQIGLNLNITQYTNIGFSTFNPFQTNIKSIAIEKRIPSLFSLGVQHFFSDDLAWRVQVDREISSSYRIATGFEYEMSEFLNTKIGTYYNNYLVMCIGVGFKLSGFYFDVNAEMHPIGGINLLGALRYKF
jgi:hypothetical protein